MSMDMAVFCETEDAQNGESRETGDKTKENKTKTQHDMCLTPLSASKHK